MKTAIIVWFIVVASLNVIAAIGRAAHGPRVKKPEVVTSADIAIGLIVNLGIACWMSYAAYWLYDAL